VAKETRFLGETWFLNLSGSEKYHSVQYPQAIEIAAIQTKSACADFFWVMQKWERQFAQNAGGGLNYRNMVSPRNLVS
jgi:hypothetical protein